MDPKISSFMNAMDYSSLKIKIKRIYILSIKMFTIIMILTSIKYRYLNKVTMNTLLNMGS